MGTTKFSGASAGAPVRQRGVRVVRHLRQQPAEADAVGRAQRHARRGSRRRRAAVFTRRWQSSKRAVHAERADVVAEAAELVRLPRRYAAIGIEDDDAEAGPAVEGGGHRRAGVAGGGDEDGQRPVATRQRGEAAGKEARAVVLERGGGTVEQLQQEVARRCRNPPAAARRRTRRGRCRAGRSPAGRRRRTGRGSGWPRRPACPRLRTARA